jgi:putative ABC transport system permease protein
MKYLGYVFRNARRNPVRSILTIGSISVCGFLTMILLSLFSINGEVGKSLAAYNRIIAMSSQGFARPVPIALVREVIAIDENSGTNGILETPDGLPAVSPLAWYGGRYGDDPIPFAQFGVDADTIFTISDELTVPPEQIEAFRNDRAGVAIGRKLAEEKGLKPGDPFPLKGDIYPFDLNLNVRAIFDGPKNSDLRSAFFHWSYLNEGLKRDFEGQGAENAGTVYIKCKNAQVMPVLSKLIDESTKNSDNPTRTQTEEAFVAMFAEMSRDLQRYINWVGMAVALSLVLICGVSMAMSMRERTTEVAVLKAIGFPKGTVLGLVLCEAVLIAGLGGLLGSVGTKFLFDSWDISRYSAGFVPFFYVPWDTALMGLSASLVIGLLSGLIPALQASRLSVVDGLRRVV